LKKYRTSLTHYIDPSQDVCEILPLQKSPVDESDHENTRHNMKRLPKPVTIREAQVRGGEG